MGAGKRAEAIAILFYLIEQGGGGEGEKRERRGEERGNDAHMHLAKAGEYECNIWSVHTLD